MSIIQGVSWLGLPSVNIADAKVIMIKVARVEANGNILSVAAHYGMLHGPFKTPVKLIGCRCSSTQSLNLKI